MLTAAIDANVLVSGAIAPSSPPADVLKALLAGDFLFITSAETVAEVERVLARPAIDRRNFLSLASMRLLLARLHEAEVPALPIELRPIRCRDPKDDPIRACALGGDADYLVTGDDDLLVLDGEAALGKLHIVTPRAFLDVLGAGSCA